MVHIQIPFNRESFIKAQKFKQQATTSRLKTNAIVHLLLGCLLTVVNANSCDNKISFALSWIILSFGILYLIRLIEINAKFRRTIKAYANKFELDQMDCEYTFSEDGIAYKDNEKSFYCKWSVLIAYSLFKSYLIFHIQGKESCDLVIDRKNITEEQFLLIDRYLSIRLKQVIL